MHDAGHGGRIDPDAGGSYARSLARARAATKKRDYAGAIAAFDEALASVPEEPRALAERGYAKLLAGDVDAAEKDFERARGRTTDAALASQIWFNLGLCAEKRGAPVVASDAFAHAYALKPSAAAKAKLGDGGTCIATIEATRRKLTHYDRWPAGWDTCGPGPCLAIELVADAGADEPPAPTDDFGGRVAPHHFIMRARGGGYDAVDEPVTVATIDGRRCGEGMALLEVQEDGEPLHVRVVHMVAIGNAFDYETDDAGEQLVVGYHCAAEGSDTELTDLFIDTTRHEIVLVVKQEGTNGIAATIVKTDGGVAVAGAGCDEHRGYPPP